MLALPLAAALGACTEDLQTGETCPLLCPGQQLEVRDTILDDVVTLDTALIGFPLQGSEELLLLARRGDTLDVRPVVRFDTLQRIFAVTGEDTLQPITDVDSAYVSIFLRATEIATPAQWFIDIYNVFDSTLVDTIPGQLVPLFNPANLIGTYEGDTAFTDTLRIRVPIDTTALRTILGTPGQRLRVGFQVRAAEPIQLRMHATEAGNGPTISYKIVSVDSTVPKVSNLPPSSFTPAQPSALAGDLADFQIVVAAPNHEIGNTFTVGGLPGSRAYLRFALPLWLTDSVGLLRAELLLTQSPTDGAASGDSLRLDSHLVLANAAVPSLFRAATLVSGAGVFAPSLIVIPSQGSTIRVNVNGFVRQWNTNNTARALPTAMILRSSFEGTSAGTMRFFSSETPVANLRPRLRVSYTPAAILGRP